MPVQWLENPQGAPEHSGALSYSQHGGVPILLVNLWPHRSLSPVGFVTFIGISATLLCLPLLVVLGSPVLWVLLGFFTATIWAIWFALRKSLRDGAVAEKLILWSDRVTLSQRRPDGTRSEWSANPYWVDVRLHQTKGPVDNYVTLKGDGREVEIGAFLSVEERLELYPKLASAIARARALL